MANPGPLRTAYHVIRLPLDDYLAALSQCVSGFRAVHAPVMMAAFALSWWVYVPIHELLHAAGCWVTGGTVTRLEIDPLYGAAWLHGIFPFVQVGSDYAGQLTGFDTHGSDLTYLATDLLPFALTVLIGVPLLRSAARPGGRLLWRCVKLGAAMPVAYAPFISVTGDYYEMGSILVSRCAAWWSPTLPLVRWRSDDLFKLASTLMASEPPAGIADAVGLTASLLVGMVLMFATYWLGSRWARMIGGSDAPRI